MLFSSNLFLFVFLPLFIGCLFLAPQRSRNALILVFSLGFYFIGSASLLWILVASICGNYFIGRRLKSSKSRIELIIAIIANLALLVYFKYAGFFWTEIVSSIAAIGFDLNNSALEIALPIGISFYTFQSISYLIDVYRGTIQPERSLINFGMYLSNFPQLIAGPIVRYKDIEKEVSSREIGVSSLYDGSVRFTLGLSKKVLIADPLGQVVDQIFALPQNELTTPLAWFGILAYTLQIFFDFSGYSDMAIGLGKMMGFNFPENFNQPYRSTSVTEFWRRWHMTLSGWFRDYLYIPLGGNRKGPWRTYFNLFTVFVLCGFWHGAAYTFLIWGLLHGTLLAFERLLLNKFNWQPNGFLGWLYTLIFVMLAWVVFRAETLSTAKHYWKALLFQTDAQPTFFGIWYYINPHTLAILIIGSVVAILPLEKMQFSRLTIVAAPLTYVFLLISITYLSVNLFNPFIYFRF